MSRIQGLIKRLDMLALAALLAGCSGFGTSVAPGASTTRVPPPVTAPTTPVITEPVLTQEGACSAPAPAIATAIVPGISECDLVRLKGATPTDILIGQGGTGEREVQVMYAEPGGRVLYFFTGNKLTRTFTPGQG